MLESAYYQVNPPQRAAVVRRERSPMELFIHHVLHRFLSRSSYPRALILLRKMDWQDSEVRHRLFNGFCKIWKAKFSNIALFALLVYDLGKYHSDFAVSVADRILENIRLGLEVHPSGVAAFVLSGELTPIRLGRGTILSTISAGWLQSSIWASCTTFSLSTPRSFWTAFGCSSLLDIVRNTLLCLS